MRGQYGERARTLIADWQRKVIAELAFAPSIVDVHTHLGSDIDGMKGVRDELLENMTSLRIATAFTFCLNELDRDSSFRAPNDRTLAAARESDGKLVPFVRLDLGASSVREATRCLDAGARGIKLHPRAQEFELDNKAIAPIFAIAHERRIPILIHGGRGLPPIAGELARLVEQYPDARVILAHAGIADMRNLAGQLAGKEGVFFDTSVWSATDLLELFHLVPVEQILFGSDYPYGQPASMLLMLVRAAQCAGLGSRDLEKVLSSNADAVIHRAQLPRPTAPRGGDAYIQVTRYMRIYQYITMAIPLFWTDQRDAVGALGLAINAADSELEDGAELRQIRELLECAAAVWREASEEGDIDARYGLERTLSRLLSIAGTLAATSGCSAVSS
jgi:predicted TIM-barrel fold metal-dependent hydrolase